MEREIEYSRGRQLDEKTIKDLLCIQIEQVLAAGKVSEALNTDFVFPMSEMILEIILDAMGAPDGDDFRQPFHELFYEEWALQGKFKTVDQFYEALKYHLSDHLTMYRNNREPAND